MPEVSLKLWGAVMFSFFYCILLCCSGCRTISMTPSSSSAGVSINSFLRPDGSLMYFIQNLEWKSPQKNEHLNLDITIHTSNNQCDSSTCQLSWFTQKDTLIHALEITPLMTPGPFQHHNVWHGKRMYKHIRRKYIEHRFEFIIPTHELVTWLEIGQGKCLVLDQSWGLTRLGIKSNILAQQLVFPEWQLTCQQP